jgi:altronate hydrolase
MSNQNIQISDPLPQGKMPFDQAAIRLHLDDDVAIVKYTLAAGTILERDHDNPPIAVKQLVTSGHKIALRDIQTGDPIHRYGQIIGFATNTIQAGEHVHTHNLSVQDFSRDYALGTMVKSVEIVPEKDRRTFQGFFRSNGRVGTRNYIAVISTVNCSAFTTRKIAHHFTPERLAAYPNVDGVIPFAHQSGCANRINGADYLLLQRTLAGMATHPNVAGYILIGLGCETNQITDLIANYDLAGTTPPPHFTIQDEGGIGKTTQAGIAAVEALLPIVNQSTRTEHPISELTLALQCGGSDGWSGVTANPAVGWLSDKLVRQGGTVVLGETPEIYGAEHLLIHRAMNQEVGDKLIEKVQWWEEHTARIGIEIDNNPSVGNKVGGLTTIYEKSLGAIAKGGTTPLMGVYDYAERVTARGFTFMDTPGYDPVGVTGQVAGGSNLVLFTTGRGSVFGYKPAPSIKIATNTAIYERMIDDMDINAGSIIEDRDISDVADDLLDLVIRVASGEQSKSEAQGVGEDEFVPWNLGGTL